MQAVMGPSRSESLVDELHKERFDGSEAKEICTVSKAQPERTVKSELTHHHRKPKASYKVIAQGS